MIKKRNLFFLLVLFLAMRPFCIFAQAAKAELRTVSNKTPYDLFVEEVKVTPQKTLSEAPLPREIPKELPGIKITGVGKNVLEFYSGNFIEFPPLVGQGYGWLDEEFQRAEVTVVFQAKAETDIRVAFDDKFTTNPIYTIVIGGDGNTRSSILKNGVEMAHATRDENPDAMISIISAQEAEGFIPFWVCYDKGLILVGKGDPGNDIFLSWKDPDPNLYVNKVAFSSNDRKVQYANIILLPPIITFPPKTLYQTIEPKPIAKKIEPLQLIKDDKIIRYGSVVKINNFSGNKGLQVYVPPSVICGDEGDWWIIKGPNGTPDSYKFGEPIRNGSQIRLENLKTRKNLNSKEGVTVFGQRGKGDAGDNWIIEIEGKAKVSTWSSIDKICLVSEATKGFLFFNAAQGAIVKTSAQKTPDTLWNVSAYNSPITSGDLPTGSVITLKTPDNTYLSVQKISKKVAEELKFGDSILLKNVKEVIGKSGQEAIKQENYLMAVGATALQGGVKKQRWLIQKFDDPQSTAPIKYGNVVSLKSTYGKYLGVISADKVLAAFVQLSKNNSFVIIDPKNPLNRGSVLKGDSVVLEALGRSYISCADPQAIILKRYAGENEVWEIEREGAIKQRDVVSVFAGEKDVSAEFFTSQFRVLREGGELKLQSLANNQNLTAQKLNLPLVTMDSTTSKAQKFLIRKVGNEFFIQSLFNNGILNYQGMFVQQDGNPVGYAEGSNFIVEVISKPDIEILEATYGAADKIYDVTTIVQSLVNGSQLIIPVGQKNKIKLFGDPARGQIKQLSLTYADKDGKEIKNIIPDDKYFFLGVQQEFEQTGVLDLSSGAEGSYIWLPYTFRIPGRVSMIFEANAAPVYIAFANKPEDVGDKEIYEIVIGADNNSKVILRRKHDMAQLAYSTTPGIISPGENKFWCSVGDGIILVGKGELGQGLLLAYKDRMPLLDLNAIGISNGANPLICQNFGFSDSVGIGAPPEMRQNYEKLYQTFSQSVRKLIVLSPFTYAFYHREGKQIVVQDELGKIEPIEQTAQEGLATYPFSIIINEYGDPLVRLEWMPGESGLRKGLGIAGAALSSVGQAATAIPMPKVQAAGAIVGAVGGLASIARDALGGGTEYVRTEVYQRQAAQQVADPLVQANNQRIQELMANIRQSNPMIPEQFKYMIDAYREIFLLIISEGNVNPVLKDQVFTDLRELTKAYIQNSPDTYNKLMNALLLAHNNRFLFTLKGDESKRKYIFNSVNEVAKTLFNYLNEIEIESLFGEYLWLEQELPEIGNGSISFEVNGEKDVFVAFSTEMGKIRDTQKTVPLYELIIGTANNTASIFRLDNKGHDIRGAIVSQNDSPEAVLELGKFKKFWFSIKTEENEQGNKIARLIFGHDAFVPKNILLEWVDNRPYPGVKYVGIGSWGALFTVKNIKIGMPLGDTDESDMYPIWQDARKGAPAYPEVVKLWMKIKQQKAIASKKPPTSMPPKQEIKLPPLKAAPQKKEIKLPPLKKK